MNALKQALFDVLRASSLAAIARAHAAQTIEAYIGARAALDALSAETASSYSLAGRSFTRRSLPELEGRVRALSRDLTDLLPEAAPLLGAPAATFCGVLFP